MVTPESQLSHLLVLLKCDPVQVAQELLVADTGIRSQGITHWAPCLWVDLSQHTRTG